MNQRVLLTGAASGIGRETARQLAARGFDLVLVDRDRDGLAALTEEIAGNVRAVPCDLAEVRDRARLCEEVHSTPPDVLINNAGILNFSPLEDLPIELVELEHRVNVVAPIALCRAAVPGMKRRGSGCIVNVGSIFGSIAFAYFASYSSTKFAIRGFSQALRRELRGSGVDVCYVAPRATKTALASQFGRMAEHVGMRMDDPARVARAIVSSVKKRRRERYVGFPESFFVRVNALFPGVVDRALERQNESTRPYAKRAVAERRGTEGVATWAA